MTSYELELDHHVDAAPHRVWQAWTTADGLRSWWWPGWSPTITVDLRVGGDYRIEAVEQRIAVHGTYRVIEPPADKEGQAAHGRLQFSWIWIDDFGTADEQSGGSESVEVTVSAVGTGTAIALRHTGNWTTPEPVTNYRLGWESVLATLSQKVAIVG